MWIYMGGLGVVWWGGLGWAVFSALWIGFADPLHIMLQVLVLTFLVIVEAILMEGRRKITNKEAPQPVEKITLQMFQARSDPNNRISKIY